MGSRFQIQFGGRVDDLKSNQDTASVFLAPTKSRKNTVYGGVRYRQNDKATLLLDLRHETKTTDLPSFDYTDNRATLTLAVSF